MEDQRQNVLAARAAVTLTAALGAAAGLLLGCVLAIPLAENRLKAYMERVTVQDDASLTEARTLLDTLGRSANPACSDTDLGNLRDLVFGSDYLKDAGRIRGGRIECSATSGRPARPVAEFKAGKTQPDGSVVYSNLAPARDQSLRRTGIQRAMYSSSLVRICRNSEGGCLFDRPSSRTRQELGHLLKRLQTRPATK
jgi:sensor c-di-GMP phosphodiesterase-like protein